MIRLDFPRRFAVRTGWGRGRLPLVLLVVGCLVAVTAAISGAATPTPGLRFAPGGHWIASPALGVVLHVNGAARSVDARADVGGIEPGSQVVQGDTSGYVVGRSRIVEFGKSSLSVERTLAPPTGERPVPVEAPGGPYLVFREAGRVVRLGESLATIPAGGALGEPVTTRDGTLWLHRLDSGALCRLAAGVDRISCPAAAPPGHIGALTVVDERPVFVDTTADTLSAVADDGLGRPTRIGKDVPPDARIAPVDVDGRVAILDPTDGRMDLVDATGLGSDRTGAAPVSVKLPDGAYSAPSVSGKSVVLLDLRRNMVLTYDGAGTPQRTIPVPPEAGEPRLSRGEDQRVYVDGAEGRHVMVVDHDGAVGVVPVTGAGDRESSRTPVTPSTESVPEQRQPPRNPGREPPAGAGRDPGGQTDRDAGGPTTPRRPPERQPVPASPPGTPQTRTVTLSRGSTEDYNDECRAPDCGLMHIVMRGFAPNTEYAIRAYTSTNPDWVNSVRLTTNGSGFLDFERFHYGVVGATVWVEVDMGSSVVRSNRYVWVSG